MAIKAQGKGVLFLVCGPSGAGKDALIELARRRLVNDGRFLFPLRSISRSEGFGDELHVAVTPAQFDRLRRQGAFALYWGAGGLNYAIPASVDLDLAAGRSVVVNGSPAILAEARSRYPNLAVIWVAANAELRRRRLVLRGRESLVEIERRLNGPEEPPADVDVDLVVNEGSLAVAARHFISIIESRVAPLPAGSDLAMLTIPSRL